MIDKEDIEKHYKTHESLYRRLSENIKQALIVFLEDHKISYHTISFRIKEFNSYFEKIERKGYENPQEQIEDFCGIRIICFYQFDLEKISQIIHGEFEVLESIDKTTALEPDRFGYRSNHYIVKIKPEWAKAPNFRGLEGLKAEIQVRTILMHAWADIEHKLAYKKKEQIPTQFRRKLNQISALLEIADEQFQQLKDDKENFKTSLIFERDGQRKFDFSKELSLDTLQAYLDFSFPDRRKDINVTRRLFEEILPINITLLEFEEMKKQAEPILDRIEGEVVKEGKWSQVGVFRMVLDLKTQPAWRPFRSKLKDNDWQKIVIRERNALLNTKNPSHGLTKK